MSDLRIRLRRRVRGRRQRRLPAAALFLLAVLAAGCNGGGPPPYTGPPVLVVGMDGLEWSVLEPLLERGELPNFQRLLANGTGGELRTTAPTFSPVLWTSIATGVREERHGIRFFTELGPDGAPKPEGLPYTSECRRVPAVWNMADRFGRSVLAVAWWVSWPAERLEHGRVVASYAGQAQANVLWKPLAHPGGLPELTWPRELQEELRPLLRLGAPGSTLDEAYRERFGELRLEGPLFEAIEPLFRAAFRGDRVHTACARDLLEEESADLTLLYLGLPDVAGHYYWRFREPEAYRYPVRREGVEALGDRIDRAYREADARLGEILEAAPAGSRIVVLSDHGMHAGNLDDRAAVQSGTHEDAPPGVLILSGPGVRRLGLLPRGERTLGSIFDICPTLLDWLGLPVPEGSEGRSLREWMEPSWRREHPEPKVFDYAEGFRAPLPPREPVLGSGRSMADTFLDQLGYGASAGG